MKNCCNIDQKKEQISTTETNVVSKFLLASINENDLSNILPLNLVFFQNSKNIYSILEKNDVTSFLKSFPYIKLDIEGLIHKIVLLDFPCSNYILSLNSTNYCSSVYNIEQQTHEFNLEKGNSIFGTLKEISIGHNEPNLMKRNDYLNFNRISRSEIIFPKDLKIGEKYNICIYGFFYEIDKWVYCSKNMVVYPNNTHYLYINEPTESLDLKIEGNGSIRFNFNTGDEFDFDTVTGTTKIKFVNPFRLFEGIQNQYLSDEINKNVINMSNFEYLSITTINCNILQIYQNHYRCYNYPERRKLFSN